MRYKLAKILNVTSKMGMIDAAFLDKLKRSKCVRCESHNGVGPYEFKRIMDKKQTGVHTYMITTTRVIVPVCDKCKQDFNDWHEYRSNTKRWPLIFGVIGLIIIFGMIFGADLIKFIEPTYDPVRDAYMINFQFLFYLPLVLLPVIFGLTYNLSIIRIARQMDNCPDKYFKFLAKNKLYVRPGGKNDWYLYNVWLDQTSKIC